MPIRGWLWPRTTTDLKSHDGGKMADRQQEWSSSSSSSFPNWPQSLCVFSSDFSSMFLRVVILSVDSHFYCNPFFSFLGS